MVQNYFRKLSYIEQKKVTRTAAEAVVTAAVEAEVTAAAEAVRMIL